ncbi:MAG TPA: phosphodiester glycosidase family protein [Flavobacterium sp.]|nr:phosphodiester glycosidase family protein [Flavobacterium sp.]
MKAKIKILIGIALLLSASGAAVLSSCQNSENPMILSFIADLKAQDLQFYWKGDKGEKLKSIQNLKSYVEGKRSRLVFAMNGGMFDKECSPKGLFIQNKKMLVPLDTASGRGNFYLKPNGVFYVTAGNIPFVCKTDDFLWSKSIKNATQSGPMLVVDGKIHPDFRQGSKNLNIRNGVGILPDNKVVFAMSKNEINFYDFARYFQDLGCRNALYLDGFVSRTYLPEKEWIQTDGNFGVMIGVIRKK